MMDLYLLKLSTNVWPNQHLKRNISTKNSSNKIRKMAEVLKLGDYKSNSQSAIELDSMFLTFRHGIEKGFTSEKIFLFMSVLRSVLQSMSTGDIQNSFDIFQNGVTNACKTNSTSQNPLSLKEAKAIADYIYQKWVFTSNTNISSYFSHYRLYQYVFRHQQEETVRNLVVNLETPKPPPALGTLETIVDTVVGSNFVFF
jgi:hypothetical protein